MEIIKRNQTPALVVVFLILFYAAMIYFASQLPPYSPYHLNEQFTSLDPNVWEIGGMKNYSLSNGVLTLFDSTNATHYFTTAPKWQSPLIEPRLQGSLYMKFKADEAANCSVFVASTDSWAALAYNGTLRLNLSGALNEQASHAEAVMSPGWHILVAENGPDSFNMTLDSQVILATGWNGNLTRIELGTGLSSFDGFGIRGDLAVSAVKADLQPLVQPQMVSPSIVALQGSSQRVLAPRLENFHRVLSCLGFTAEKGHT